MDRKSIPAYKMLVTAYYNMHQYGIAEKTLSQTLMLDPDDKEAKDLLAKISNNKTNKELTKTVH